MAQLTIQQAFDLAVQHHQAGRLREAEQLYRQILAQEPEHADAMHYLGVVAAQMGRYDIAVDLIRRAIALRPDLAEAHSNLGNALRDNGQLDEAIAAYRQGIALKPDYAEAHSNLGKALRRTGQIDQAIAACRQAIALKPDLPQAYGYLGNALIDKGQLEEAIAAYRQALSFNPNYAEAHFNLALALLVGGDWKQGWLEYEWRWKIDAFASANRGFSQPLWDGSDLGERTILLHAEQGMGDTIQFMRYLPLVVERGGHILVEAHRELIRLLRQLPGVERWIARGEPLGAFDVQCPLMSLAHLFQTTPQTIPAQKSLLLPAPDLAQAWQRRLEQQPPGLRVGLVWAADPKHMNSRDRSIALSLLAPLATVEGIRFYSLQKGEAARQAAHAPAGMRIIDWTEELHDFADTAALVVHLDLIISIDTSVAHLAAAMGKPVWLLLSLLLSFQPDSRWLQNRDDSPWYPTMRLFRQTTGGDWGSVISRVVEALGAFAAPKPT